MLRFLIQQYKHGCRAGFGRRRAFKRAVRVYVNGF
jgi:hypothetical protein